MSYENVIHTIESKKAWLEKMKEKVNEDSGKNIIKAFGYECEIDLCESFLKIFKEHLESEQKTKSITMKEATRRMKKQCMKEGKMHVQKVEHPLITQKEADKELMNPKCAGQLGVWNEC